MDQHIQFHSDRPPRYLPLGTLSNLVILGLGCCLIVGLLRAHTAFAENELINALERGETVSDQIRLGLMQKQVTLYWWQLATIFGCGVFFIAWFHRAYRNISSIGGRWTIYPVKWAILAWIVPIINTFRPYQIAQEIWIRSVARPDSAVVAVSSSAHCGLIDFWWGSAFAMSLSLRFSVDRDGSSLVPGEAMTSDYVVMISGALTVIASAIAIKFVSELTTRHERAMCTYRSLVGTPGVAQPYNW